MSDLETRLTEALSRGAEGAPAALGLAAAARSRARERRRTKLIGVAAVAAFCVGVPAGVVAATHGSGSPPRPDPSRVATDSSQAPQVPAGFRVESWHGVSVQVPVSWGWGNLSDWCAGGGSMTPRVQRPGAASLDIKCPTSAYGITFQSVDSDEAFDWPVVEQTGGGLPQPAWEGAHGVAGVLVSVVAPTEQQALDILASVQPFGAEGDANGCPPAAADKILPGDGMSICRFDVTGGLEQSERLVPDQATKAELALRGAPQDARRGPPCSPGRATTVIRMVSGTIDATVSFGAGCELNDKLIFEGDQRMLTQQVLFWALSPGWSGSVPDGVSLPSVLRTK